MKSTQTPALPSIVGRTIIRGILAEAVKSLGTDIVGGRWAEGEVISKESDLVQELDVSRSVVREACRMLSAKGLIRSRTSDGTRVQPRSNWRLLDADVIHWRLMAGDRDNQLRDLLNLRLTLEPGIAYQATLCEKESAQQRIHTAWQQKCASFDAVDLDLEERRKAFIATDIEFHLAFASATESELVLQLFGTIHSALDLMFDHQMRARGYTDRMVGMEDSHELHRKVYEAFKQRDAERAEICMRELIKCAIVDAEAGFVVEADVMK